MDYLYIIGSGYLVIAFMKTLLALPGVGTAARVMAKHGCRGGSVASCFALLLLTLPLVTLFTWPQMLRSERMRFFLVYSDRQIIRQIVGAMQ
jgi:hypothetical protein